MYIQTVTTSNFKGADTNRAHSLHPFTIITGKNGTGKSRITDAIQAAALGYVPWLGKTGPALRQLAGPGLEMAVDLILSDGQRIRRSWKKTKSGLSKKDAPTEAPNIPLFSLDPGAFLAANDQQRARMIAARFGIQEDPREKILSAIEAAAAGADLPNFRLDKEEDFSLWVENISEGIAAALSAANATAKRMKTTLEGLAALESDPVALVPDAEVSAAQKAVGARSSERDALSKELATLRQRIAELKAELESAPLMPEISEAAQKSALAEIEKEITELQTKQKAAAEGAKKAQEAAANIAAAEKRLKGIEFWLEQNAAPEPLALAALPQPLDMEKLTRELAAAEEAERAAFRALTLAQGADLSGSHCKCCGAARENWSEDKIWETEDALSTAQAAHSTAAETVRRTAALFKLETENAQKRKEQADASRAHAAAVKEHEQYTAREREAGQLLELLRAQASEVPAFSQEDAEVLNALLEDKEKAEADLKEWTAYKESQEGRALLNEAETRAATVETDLLPQAARALSDAEITAETIATRAKAAREAVAQQETASKARAENEKAAEEVKKIKAAKDALEAAESEATGKIVKPLLDIAGQICAGCLPTPLAHKGLSFGRFDGPHFISLNTFSESEKAAAVSAITAGMAAAGQGIAIIDEFNNLDADKRPVMLANLAAALEAGTLAQAIILDNEPDNYDESTTPPGAYRLML